MHNHPDLISRFDESVIDTLTAYGRFPLLFSGLLGDSNSHLQIISSHASNSRVFIRDHLFRNSTLANAARDILLEQGATWESLASLADWSHRMNWPYRYTLEGSRFALVDGFDSVTAYNLHCFNSIDNDNLATVRYPDFKYFFGLGSLVLTWNPCQQQFMIPKIQDYIVHLRIIKLLQLSHQYYAVTSASSAIESIRSVYQQARDLHWSGIDTCLSRLDRWASLREQSFSTQG